MLTVFCNGNTINRFVNLMEGDIWIESDGLGKGCTAIFIVKLGIPPRSNENMLSVLPSLQSNQAQANFSGLRALIMDVNG